MRRLLYHTIHDIALMRDRVQAGREARPSAGVLDSQTVKAPRAPRGNGYDAAKRTESRKRHIAVDIDGWLLMVNLTTTNVQDAAGVEKIVAAVRRRWRCPSLWLKHLFANGTYDRGKLASAVADHDFVLAIIRKLHGQVGFQVLPWRWVVERTFGWTIGLRRLVRNYEKCLDVSRAMTQVSVGVLLLRRVDHP